MPDGRLRGLDSDPAQRASAVLEIDVAGIVANWRHLAARVAPADCAAVARKKRAQNIAPKSRKATQNSVIFHDI